MCLRHATARVSTSGPDSKPCALVTNELGCFNIGHIESRLPLRSSNRREDILRLPLPRQNRLHIGPKSASTWRCSRRASELRFAEERKDGAPEPDHCSDKRVDEDEQAQVDHVRALGRATLLWLPRGEHDRSCDGALAFRRQEHAHPLDELRREERIARAVVYREPSLVVRRDVDEPRSLELPAEDTLRQRAGYSASPGVGIGHHLRRELLV